jgi:large subunit ribosomal protein L5
MTEPEQENPMRRIEIDKVVINMGVGEGGEKLAKAEKLLTEITGQKPIKRTAKRTIQPFNVKKHEAIGVKVTLRGDRAQEFLKRCFAIQNTLYKSQFDTFGNFSFGIAEHTDFGMRYDPNVGIFGMDICVSLKRPGYRIKDRKLQKRKLPLKQRTTPEEVFAFLERDYGVELIGEEE